MENERKVKPIQSKELSKRNDPRYVVIDVETFKVLDDAQGYGYKSAQNAMAAWSYKNRSPSRKTHDAAAQKAVREFCDKHRDIVDLLEAGEWDVEKYGDEVTAEEYEEFFRDQGFTDLPFTVAEFLKYRK